MIIQKLILENFISHSHTEIDFTQGVNIIVGHNGAGKSSIIDGIKLALFGEARGKYIQDMVKKGQRESSVYLEFSFGGNSYSVYRTITLGKSSQKGDAVLKRDGVMLAQTIKGVSTALSEILGIRKEIALNSVFVEQGQMDSLISSERAVRERTFSSILDLDTLSECAASLRDMARDYDARLQGLSFTQEDLVKAEEKLSGIDEEILHLEKERKAVEDDLRNLSEKQKFEEENLSLLRERESRMRSLNQSIETALMQSVSLEREIEATRNSIRSIEMNIEKIENSGFLKIIGIQAQIEDFLRKAQRETLIRRSLSETERALETLQDNRILMEQLRENAMKYRSVSEENSRWESELASLRDRYYRNSSSKDRASKLKVELESKTRRIIELETAIRKSLEMRDNQSMDITAISKVIDSELENIRQRIAECKASRERASTIDESLENQIMQLRGKSKCPLCEQPLTEDHVSRLSEETRKKRAELQQSKKEVEEELESLLKSESRCVSKSRYLRSVEVQEYQALIREKDNHEKEIMDLQLIIDETNTDSEKYLEINEKLTIAKGSVEQLQKDFIEYERARRILDETDEKDIQHKAESLRAEMMEIEEEKNNLKSIVSFRDLDDLSSILSNARSSSQTLELEKERLKSAQRDLQYRIKLKSEADSSVERMRSELEPFRQIPDLILKQKKICDGLRNEITQKTSAVANFDANLRSRMERRMEIEAETKNIQDSLLKKEKIRKSLTVLKRMRECFDRDGIQKLIRQSATEFISDRMREYISMFGLRFDDLTVHDDMDVEVQQDGVVQSLSMLSGGERTAVSIGLRLALARYLSENINTIIMDEPTNYLDEERRSSLKDIIQNAFMNERIVPQMIIVTHHSELTAASDSTFTVSKVGGSSQVSAVF